jgi:flavin-binding protein dodecin
VFGWAGCEDFHPTARHGARRPRPSRSRCVGAWVAEQKVKVDKSRISEYRVTMRVSFVLED